MKFKTLEILSHWQFRPSASQPQPDYVAVTTALHGPRAIVRPPKREGAPIPVILHLAPGDWLLELSDGSFTKINEHAGSRLLDHADPS